MAPKKTESSTPAAKMGQPPPSTYKKSMATPASNKTQPPPPSIAKKPIATPATKKAQAPPVSMAKKATTSATPIVKKTEAPPASAAKKTKASAAPATTKTQPPSPSTTKKVDVSAKPTTTAAKQVEAPPSTVRRAQPKRVAARNDQSSQQEDDVGHPQLPPSPEKRSESTHSALARSNTDTQVENGSANTSPFSSPVKRTQSKRAAPVENGADIQEEDTAAHSRLPTSPAKRTQFKRAATAKIVPDIQPEAAADGLPPPSFQSNKSKCATPAENNTDTQVEHTPEQPSSTTKKQQTKRAASTVKENKSTQPKDDSTLHPPSTTKKIQPKRTTTTTKDNSSSQLEDDLTQPLSSTTKKPQPKRAAATVKDNKSSQPEAESALPSSSITKKTQPKRATTIAKDKRNTPVEEDSSQPPSSPTKKPQPRGKKRHVSEDGDELAQDPVFSTKRARKSMPAPSTPSVRKPAPTLRSSSKAPISSPTPTPTPRTITVSLPTDSHPTLIPTTEQTSSPQLTQTKPPFCCANSLPIDPYALYTCANTTVLQRNAILLLQRELKTFDHAIPLTSPLSLKRASYMIQITKFIPSAADQIALLSTSRAKASVVKDIVGDGYRAGAWEIDTSAGAKGRFFVEAEKIGRERLVEGGVLSIWEEVDGLEMEKWEVVEESRLEFRCDEHQEEKWVCVYWKARK